MNLPGKLHQCRGAHAGVSALANLQEVKAFLQEEIQDDEDDLPVGLRGVDVPFARQGIRVVVRVIRRGQCYTLVVGAQVDVSGITDTWGSKKLL